MRPDKNQYYIGIAEAVAKRSTCLRRQYGAVIVKDDPGLSLLVITELPEANLTAVTRGYVGVKHMIFLTVSSMKNVVLFMQKQMRLLTLILLI